MLHQPDPLAMGAAMSLETLMTWSSFLELEANPGTLKPMTEGEQASTFQALAAAGVGKWRPGT